MDDKEREKCFFIFILFDTSVAFYASVFCDSVQIMWFFLPSFSDQGGRSVGPGYSIFANCICRGRYTVLHFEGAVRLVEP